VGAGRGRAWLLVLLVAAALVVTVPGLVAATRAWPLWLSLVLNVVALLLAVAARGAPTGATRDFLTWLAFGAWLLWAAWWVLVARFF
jgi:hypothetical protein